MGLFDIKRRDADVYKASGMRLRESPLRAGWESRSVTCHANEVQQSSVSTELTLPWEVGALPACAVRE